MSGNLSSTGLYLAVQRRRNRGLAGLYIVVAVFLLLYVWLFPGILSLGGFSKFTQNWFPLALVTMAQALLMLNGGITLAVGPMVSLGGVIAATTMGGPAGTAGGIAFAAIAGLAIGSLIGAMVAYLRLPAIIVTLAGSFIITGVADGGRRQCGWPCLCAGRSQERGADPAPQHRLQPAAAFARPADAARTARRLPGSDDRGRARQAPDHPR